MPKHEDTEGSVQVCIALLTAYHWRWMEVSGQRHTSATLPRSPRRSPVTLFRGRCVGCRGDLDGYEAEKVLFHRGSNLGPSSSKLVAVLTTLSRPVFEHSFNSMEVSPAEKLTGRRLDKKFPAFYGTRTFITAFTNASHLPQLLSQIIFNP